MQSSYYIYFLEMAIKLPQKSKAKDTNHIQGQRQWTNLPYVSIVFFFSIFLG